MRILRIAVVGTGGRAQTHLSTIKKLTDLYSLCAVCDANEDRARENSGKWRASAYTNVPAMLEGEKPDVVFAVVPPDAHHVIAAVSAAHGASVITETPIATTLTMADVMMEAGKRHGVKVEVSENVWRWPQERLKRMIVDAGIIGEVTHARLWYASGSYHGFNAIRTLVKSEAKRVLGYGGTVAVHPHEGYGGSVVHQQEWESGVIEFENGVACLYEFPPHGHRGNFWEIEGTNGQIIGNEVFTYENGKRVRRTIQETFSEVDGQSVLDSVRLDTDPPIVWENPFKRHKLRDMDDISRAQVLAGVHKAVTEGGEPEYGAANGRRDQELCIAVRESAVRGSVWVDLPFTETTRLEERQHDEFRKQYGHDPADVEALANLMFPHSGVKWMATGRS